MPAKKKASSRRQKPEIVHQFLVALTGTDPLVWRRIQGPERYSFWELHVAIQDATGWQDYHLHEFRLLDEAAPDHEEHERLTWASGEFDPEAFDPAAVIFEDPQRRWRNAFGRAR
jgi:hypothetical protein